MNLKSKNSTIPKLRFLEFKETPGWMQKTLIQTASIVSGQSPDGESYNIIGEGFPFYQGKTDFGLIFLNKPTKWTTKPTKFANNGDILMSVRAPVGALNISIDTICIGRGLAAIQAKENKWFLYYLLCSIQKEIVGNGGSIFDSINKEQIEKIVVFTPKPEEQQKIADCLSSLDDLITAETQKLDALKDHKKGLMQQLFPGEGEMEPKLRFEEFRGSGAWDEDTLDNVAIFLKGKGISKADISANGSIPCIRYGELYTQFTEIIYSSISFTDLPPSDLIFSEKNDVIIPSSGETREDIATASCIMEKGIALGGDLNIIRSEINGIFLSYYLTHNKKSSIAKLAQGDAVVHLYSSQLKKLNVNFPSKRDEQNKIADFFSSLDELIYKQKVKIEMQKAHKKGILQQLFPKINI